MFKCISLIEHVSIPIQISLKFVPRGPTNNIPALAQIMAWRRPGDKPLSEPMMDSLPTDISVTRPQWVNMLLVLSITFHFHYNIWGCMCSTGPFQYRWLKGYTCIYSSCYYHHQIGSIHPHLSHCYHIFPWLCAWDVCCIIFTYHSHLLHICSGKTGNLFSLLLCSLWWVQIFGYILACRSYSFVCSVHHLIIIIVQTCLKALNL